MRKRSWELISGTAVEAEYPLPAGNWHTIVARDEPWFPKAPNGVLAVYWGTLRP